MKEVVAVSSACRLLRRDPEIYAGAVLEVGSRTRVKFLKTLKLFITKIRIDGAPSEAMRSFLRKHLLNKPHLEDLRMIARTASVLELLGHATDLRKLVIETYCDLEPDNPLVLMLRNHGKKLEHLDIYCYRRAEPVIREVTKENCEKLKCLRISSRSEYVLGRTIDIGELTSSIQNLTLDVPLRSWTASDLSNVRWLTVSTISTLVLERIRTMSNLQELTCVARGIDLPRLMDCVRSSLTLKEVDVAVLDACSCKSPIQLEGSSLERLVVRTAFVQFIRERFVDFPVVFVEI